MIFWETSFPEVSTSGIPPPGVRTAASKINTVARIIVFDSKKSVLQIIRTDTVKTALAKHGIHFEKTEDCVIQSIQLAHKKSLG